MIDSAPASLIINAVAAPLALAFLIVMLWSDFRREINQFLGIFLAFVIIWNSSALIVQAAALAEMPPDVTRVARMALDLGFIGASVSGFSLTVVIVRAYTRRLRGLAVMTVLTIAAYRLALLAGSTDAILMDLPLNYREQPLLVLFSLLFGGGTLVLLWRSRRSVRSRMLQIGLLLLVFAQLSAFVNPELGLWVIANNLGALASLLISFALIKQEIIRPLADRTSQVETFRTVSAAIANQESLDTQLDKIVRYAASLLRADGAGIYVSSGHGPKLIYSWRLPQIDERTSNKSDSGMAAIALTTRRTIHVDNYGREWRGYDDFPFARETFGSVICTPIIHADEALGVLMVVSARQGRLFRDEDKHMLEMLATQIAVAIIYQRLFEHQQELDRLKNEMLRMASHDLKNPLQASMAYLDLLRDDLMEEGRLGALEFIDVIDKQLRRMTRIIRGVLDLEKIREGKLRLSPVPVDELLSRLRDELAEQAKDNHIDLRVEISQSMEYLEVLGDAGQLERALVNLGENAIKFTPAGGAVRVDVTRSADRIVFEIADTGVGIAQEHQPFIFDRFYRASPKGMEHVNGSGLGLSLVKAIVENHRGEVWFESSQGKGTTFFVSLPASTAGVSVTAAVQELSR
ncbi:MAG: ATP-binding protein [Anaerolineae bacterium]|nr:ATP-binding protein [Anaerolineae bacterium]NUQ02516.1 GAF domain-containing protein [Anaerolineae bacterium]